MSSHDAWRNQILGEDDAGVTIRVKVVPNASRNKVAGLLGDRLKVAVSAPPEDGKANQAVCELLAKALKQPVRHVTVAAGHTQPTKTIHIASVSLADVGDALALHLK